MKKSKLLKIPHTKIYLGIALVMGAGMFGSSAARADSASCTVSADGLTITCTGKYSPYEQSRLNYENVIFDISGAWATSPDIQGVGIYANGGSRIARNNVQITTSGSAADAIRTNGQTTVRIPGKLVIVTTGSSADAVNVTEDSSNSLVEIGNDANISTQTGVGLRANLARNATSINRIVVGDGLTVQTAGSGSNLLDSVGYAVYAGIRSWKASSQYGGAQVLVGNNSNITTQGSLAHAVYANMGGLIRLGDAATIQTGNKNAYALYAETGTAGGVSKGSVIDLLGGATVTVPTDGNAIYATGAGSVVASRNSQSNTDTSGVFHITGDLFANKEGAINLNATSGSVFISNANAVGVATPLGADNTRIDLQMRGTDLTGNISASVLGNVFLNASENSSIAGNINADSSGVVSLTANNSVYTGHVQAIDLAGVEISLSNGAVFKGTASMVDPLGVAADGLVNVNLTDATTAWRVTGDSNVGTLSLLNGSQVSLGDQSAPVDGTNKVTLTMQDLQGQGSFSMRTDVGSQLGDLLVVTNSSSGNHTLAFNDSQSGAVATLTSELKVVEYQGVDLVNNQAAFSSNGVDIGAYTYGLEQKSDGDWYLNTKGPNDPATPFTPVEPALNNSAKLSASILNINYLLGYAENQSLLQRMGELRQAPVSGGDTWVRIYTGQMDKFEGARLSSFDMDYTGVQIGVDKQIDAIQGGTAYVGIMGGTSEANANYAIGNGDVKGYHVGVYGTYKTDNGFYVDGVAKYTQMDNSFNTLTSNGYLVNGDGKSSGYSVGVEVGKRFYLGQSNQGWYLEPQGQITFSHQGGATIRSSTGLRTDLSAYDSTLGGASIIAGYSVTSGANPIDVYVKTGYVREFEGNASYTFNHVNSEKFDFGGGWWDNSIGVNMQIGGQHHIYMDATYAKGGSFDHKQLNVGYRYSF